MFVISVKSVLQLQLVSKCMSKIKIIQYCKGLLKDRMVKADKSLENSSQKLQISFDLADVLDMSRQKGQKVFLTCQ